MLHYEDMTHDGLGHFSDAVRRWFGETFPAPTDVQSRAWAQIARGNNALVVAPTGSGKTLAAFLFAIDRLMAGKAEGPRADARATKDAGEAEGKADARCKGGAGGKGVCVLYVSPLKALGADVERNLAVPLEGITRLLRQGCYPDAAVPEVTVAMRTGDTTPDARRRLLRRPPDILITTPESLYLMLTSQARETLRTVDAVIVDEIHSLAGNKRGAHLSLSLERLDDLLGAPAQRIGLSATVTPVDVVARFLGGPRPVDVVSADERPDFDVSVRVPVRDMTNIPTVAGADGITPDSRSGISSIWPYIEGAILDQVLAHRSAIVFVNSRGLCERLTARLNELYARRCGAEGAEGARAGGRCMADDGTSADGAAAPAPMIRSDIGGTTALAEDAPAIVAKAHHGSVAKEQRLAVERELKRGELPCVVATSSLELGIDMGEVDLVLQVAPPPSVSSGLQRIGRANHQVGGSSQGIVYPRVRTELVDATVAVEGMREGRIEATVLEENALDVLAQQTVAQVAASDEGVTADDWYATVRRSACYASLARTAFDAVVRMLCGGYASADLAEFSPRLNHDAESGLLTARASTKRLAVTGSGTIPDRGMFPAMLPGGDGAKGRRRVGELDEEMVHESRVGDVIMLGTSTWRIAEIGRDRVIVEPAPGRSARLPFWHGEAAGRPYGMGVLRGAFLHDLNRAVGKRLESEIGGDGPHGVPLDASPRANSGGAEASALSARLDSRGVGFGGGSAELDAASRRLRQSSNPVSAKAHTAASQADSLRKPPPDDSLEQMDVRLRKAGLDANARDNLMALAAAQQAATGVIPDGRTLVVEQCPDGTGGWNVVLHSPFGKRVHAPWALAVGLRIREELGYDPQAMAADDGIVLQVPPIDAAVPDARLFAFDPDEIDALVRANVPHTALFAARFRECAARALLMSPTAPGKRAPLWQQRLKGGQLLEAVRDEPGFPIVAEAARECLTDAYDMPSLRAVMEGIRDGGMRVVDAQTQAPSPFAAAMLFGYVAEHLYEGDLPHAESNASVLAVDPGLLEEILGGVDVGALIDDEVERAVEDELQLLADGRKAKNADGLADALRRLGPLSVDEAAARLAVYEGEDAAALAADMLGVLESERRAFPTVVGGADVWAAAFDAGWLRDALGVPVPAWAARGAASGKDAPDDATPQPAGGVDADGVPGRRPLDELALRYMRTHASASVAEFAARFGLGEAVARDAFERLAQAGRLQRFGLGGRWVAPEVLGRLRRRSLAKMQALSAPVSAAAFSAFVLERQMVAGAACEPLAGVDGVAQVIAQFEGVSLAAGLWEDVVFPSRVADYAPPMLDELLSSGEVVWVGAKHGAGLDVAFYPTDSPLCPLVEGGVDVKDDPAALQRLVEGSLATNDTFAFVRAGADVGKLGSSWEDSLGQQAPRRATSRRSHGRYSSARSAMKKQAAARVASRASLACALAGRWSAVSPAPVDDTLRALALVDSLLDRYGVVSRDVALAAGVEGGLSPLYPVLRSMVDAGDVLRGEFVEGLGPAQFASRETVERLRQLEEGAGGARLVLPAADPACVFGRMVPWPAPTGARHADNVAVFAGGAPVLFATARLKGVVAFADDEALTDAAVGELVAWEKARTRRKGSAGTRQRLEVREFDGAPVLGTAFADVLAQHGFVRTPDGMRLYVDPF